MNDKPAPDDRGAVPFDDKQDLKAEVVKASFWTVASRWGVRAIGFVSVIVLARLLDPADFGVMAMAASFIHFMDLFTVWGFDQAIVRHPAPTRDHYDTAWTIQVLVGLLCGGMGVAAAPLVADFFDEPRLTLVIWVLSGSFVISGFANIALADLQRGFQFGKDFRFLVTSRLVAFVITMIVAVTLRSYWALVWGNVALAVSRLVFGYWFVPRRPRFTLACKNELLSFSSWLVVRNFAAFVVRRFDIIVLSRVYAADIVGPYDIAKNLSNMIIAESLLPINRALLPGFARIVTDLQRLAESVTKTTGIYALIALPMGVGLAVTADEVVHVALGAKWEAAAPYLALLALGHGITFVIAPLGPLLLAQGLTRRLAFITVFQAALFVVAVLALARGGDIVLIAAAMLITAAAGMPIQLRWGLGSWAATGRALRSLGRPMVGVLVMAAAVLAVDTLPWSPVVMLVAKVAVGVLMYVTTCVLLWVVAGRPEGPESVIMEIVARFRRSRS